MVKQVNWKGLRISLGVGLLIAVLCLILQFCVSYTSNLLSANLEIISTDLTHWKADISSTPPGLYYFTIGRPKAACSILLNQDLLVTNKTGVAGIRNGILLSTSLLKKTPDENSKENPNEKMILSVECDDQTGFPASISNTPILGSYIAGQIAHLWQALLQVFLGPLISLALLLFCFLTSESKIGGRTNEIADSSFFLVAITALLYTVSLSHFPRLFMIPLQASILHVMLRGLFSFSIIFLFGIYSRHIRVLWVIHLVLFMITAPLLSHFEKDTLSIYGAQFLFFIFETALMVFQLHRVQAEPNIIIIKRIRYLSVSWFFLQTFDYVSFFHLKFGDNFGPLMLAVMCIILASARYKEILFLRRFRESNALLLRALNKNISIQDLIEEIASVTKREGAFSRVSGYIDAFYLGQAESPGVTLLRVSESGYTKDTRIDFEIKKDEDRGKFMFHTLAEQSMRLFKSKADETFFIIIPLGNFACINLSNTKIVNENAAHEAFANLQAIYPTLKTIESRLAYLASKTNISINRAKAAIGYGSFKREIGVISLDINDYSKFSARYGDPYLNFVKEKLFPAMIRLISPWAFLESVVGDEVTFIILPELIQDGASVKEATLRALKAIYTFLHTSGTKMCLENGFEPSRMSGAVNWGSAEVLCDSRQLNISGRVLIDCSRLAKASAMNQILIKTSSAEEAKSFGYEFGEDEIVVKIKKDIISAKSVRFIP